MKGDWARFFRLPLLPTVWSHLVAAAWISESLPPASVVVGYSALYLWGMGANDWADRLNDKRFNPNRPLPAGRLQEEDVVRVLAALLAFVAMALLWVPSLNFRWALAIGLMAATAYDFALKRWALAGALCMGVVRSSVIAGFIDLPRIVVWTLGVYVFAVTLWSTTEEQDPSRKVWTFRFLLALPLVDAFQVVWHKGFSPWVLGFAVVPYVCFQWARFLRKTP